MPIIPEIVTGDDLNIPVTLKKDGVTFAIDTAAIVQVAIVSANKSEILVAAIAQVSTTTGADWANSLVVVVMPSAATLSLATFGKAYMEIQVDEGGKTTWFAKIILTKGNIA